MRSWCVPVPLHRILVYHKALRSVAGVRAGQAGRAAGITSWLDQGLEVSVTALDIGLAGKAEMLGRVAFGLTSPYFPRETTDSVDLQICSRHEEGSSQPDDVLGYTQFLLK